MKPNAQSRQLWTRALAAALLIGAAATLSGCSSAPFVDHIPTVAGGLPDGVPERQAEQQAFPAVHDMPAPRNDVVLTDAEKKKLKDELIATRERITRENAANQANNDAPASTGSAGAVRNP